ncbi:MAG: undecaprenyl-diphosphate phosphatase [Clostridiales Family XIII bacterium]|jgi:undecaprenyl-diphosphatase|nr:undecaprenyl-diphosphate phosphatase [Clostridiales Family XIII bacterium]
MIFIEFLKAIVLGIIEGITEWLPISSTGHMILADEFIKLNVSAEFKEMFLVVIQLGAILAVVLLYFRRLNPFSQHKSPKEKRDTMSIWFKVVVGIVPAGVLGFLLDDWLDKHFYNYVVVSLMLIVYGVCFIVVENKNKRKTPRITRFSSLSYATAFGIGMFQVLSLIPGTSRSGATILGAILLGTSRRVAAEFSFFMSIPIMFAASGLKLIKFGFHFSVSEFFILLIGMMVAFIVSLFAIKFLMRYINKHDFKVFGWYRIVLGVVVLAYFIIT